MGEAKSFASLSSGLLARKGAAKPAMRRPVPSSHPAAHEHDDLGWNDMGYDVDPDQNADPGQDGHFHRNPLMGAVPEANANTRARQEEVAERLNGSALPSDEELDRAAAQAEASSPVDSSDQSPAQAAEMALESTQADADEPEVEAETATAGLLAIKPHAVQRTTEPLPAEPRTRRPKVESSVAAKDKTAFTLRLDQDRHLQLRLACAVRNVSAQKLVTGALDALLAGMPELAELTRHLPSRPL